ncbi:MAG: hypothetical protein GY749_37075 [Desulfobacteraceae bacterium]|nr:hypothetical protein [Desulfobacteraceae bacterium]
MEEIKEKFTIKITDTGLIIDSMAEGMKTTTSFTASEALMLLDILRNEEQNLQKMAEQASPAPFKITVV